VLKVFHIKNNCHGNGKVQELFHPFGKEYKLFKNFYFSSKIFNFL